MGKGDTLASGGVRATFTTPNVSEEKWKEMFGGDSGFEERMRKKALAEGLSEEQFEQVKNEAAAQVQQLEEERKQQVQKEQAKIKIRAMRGRIIVRRAESEDKVGNLFLADESKEKPSEGIVIAVGPGIIVDNQVQEPAVTVGERVVFGKYAGAEVQVGYEMYLVLREEDLFLVKETIN